MDSLIYGATGTQSDTSRAVSPLGRKKPKKEVKKTKKVRKIKKGKVGRNRGQVQK